MIIKIQREIIGKGIYFLFILLLMAILSYSIIDYFSVRQKKSYFENKLIQNQLENLFNTKTIYFTTGKLNIISDEYIQNLIYSGNERSDLVSFIHYLNQRPGSFSIFTEKDVFKVECREMLPNIDRKLILLERGLNKNIIYVEKGELIPLDNIKTEIKNEIEYLDLYDKIIEELEKERSYLTFTSVYNSQKGQAELKLKFNPFTIALASSPSLVHIKMTQSNSVPFLERVEDDSFFFLRDNNAKRDTDNDYVWEFDENFKVIRKDEIKSPTFFVVTDSRIHLNGYNIAPLQLWEIKNGDLITTGYTYIFRKSEDFIQESWINDKYQQKSLLGESGNNILGIRKNRYLKGVFQKFLSNSKNEIILTLNPGLQIGLYSLLEHQKSVQPDIERAGIVLQNQNGEILALAGFPSFQDLEEFREVEEIRADRNFCLEPVSPGSRIKPELAQAAYSITKPEGSLHFFNVFCKGVANKIFTNAAIGARDLNLGFDLRVPIKCAGNIAHGRVDIRTYLSKSCNIFSANFLNYIYYSYQQRQESNVNSFASSEFAKELYDMFDYSPFKNRINDIREHLLFVPLKHLMLKDERGKKLDAKLLINEEFLQKIADVTKLNMYFPLYRGYIPFDALGKEDYRTVASISIGGENVKISLLLMNNNLLRLFTGLKLYPQLLKAIQTNKRVLFVEQDIRTLYSDDHALSTVRGALQESVYKSYGTIFEDTSEMREDYSRYFSFAGKTGTHDVPGKFSNTCVSFAIIPLKETRNMNKDIRLLTVSVYIRSKSKKLHAKDLLQDVFEIIISNLYSGL